MEAVSIVYSVFLSGYLPNSTSLDSHNTQQERLNSKLVLFSPCCALLRLVTFGCFNPAMAARSAKQQCQCLFFTCFMCQHTHQYDGKQYSPCLSLRIRSSQVFPILSSHSSVDNTTYSFIQVVIYRTVLLVTVLQGNLAV